MHQPELEHYMSKNSRSSGMSPALRRTALEAVKTNNYDSYDKESEVSNAV